MNYELKKEYARFVVTEKNLMMGIDINPIPASFKSLIICYQVLCLETEGSVPNVVKTVLESNIV